jgi:hypothetical protein
MTDLLVIVPTRSRPHNVEPILQAWWETGAFGFADLLFVADADDMQIGGYQDVLNGQTGPKLEILPEWMPLVPKLNTVADEVAKTREYRYLAFMGDDHIPRTPNWASRLLVDHGHNPNWIWYGKDGFQDQNKPTWWSMDAEIVRRLGGMVPAPVQHLYCDDAVKLLGDKAGCLGYDETILIEHMHPFVGKARPDDQYIRVNRPQQYERDEHLLRSWVADGLDRDAKLLRSVGG